MHDILEFGLTIKVYSMNLHWKHVNIGSISVFCTFDIYSNSPQRQPLLFPNPNLIHQGQLSQGYCEPIELEVRIVIPDEHGRVIINCNGNKVKWNLSESVFHLDTWHTAPPWQLAIKWQTACSLQQILINLALCHNVGQRACLNHWAWQRKNLILCLNSGLLLTFKLMLLFLLMMHNFNNLNSSLELFHYLSGQQSDFVCFLHFSPYKQFVFLVEKVKYFMIKTWSSSIGKYLQRTITAFTFHWTTFMIFNPTAFSVCLIKDYNWEKSWC